jgi:hypothetical protein
MNSGIRMRTSSFRRSHPDADCHNPRLAKGERFQVDFPFVPKSGPAYDKSKKGRTTESVRQGQKPEWYCVARCFILDEILRAAEKQ